MVWREVGCEEQIGHENDKDCLESESKPCCADVFFAYWDEWLTIFDLNDEQMSTSSGDERLRDKRHNPYSLEAASASRDMRDRVRETYRSQAESQNQEKVVLDALRRAWFKIRLSRNRRLLLPHQ